MSDYLVTVPWGPLPEAFWSCLQCDARGARRPAGQIRDEASGHVRTAGHDVVFHRGTSELLLPVATTAPAPPAPKELTR